MGEAIGSMLVDLGALRTQFAAPGARSALGGPPTNPTTSFADQLDASFRSRAKLLGLDLPASSAVSELPGVKDGDDVDEIWKRAQLQSAALHGPGDAMMQAVADAADARWEQRRGRGERGLFDL